MKYKVGTKYVGALENGIFKKEITESKHLMWQFSGVPCIDANTWDGIASKVTEIQIHTDKDKTFRIAGSVFDLSKKQIDYGYGRQYYIEKWLWNIEVPDAPKPILPPKVPSLF